MSSDQVVVSSWKSPALAEGNRALRERRYAAALALYAEALSGPVAPGLMESILANQALARRRYHEAMRMGASGEPGRFLVVTPSLNAVATIDQTIASVAAQAGRFVLYYHVQDGGSTDGTLERLRDWESVLSKPNAVVRCEGVQFTWASERDQGMYEAVMRGFGRMKRAAGDWLTWINSDDVLMPGAMQTVQALAAEYPEMSWVGGATQVINSTGQPIFCRCTPTPTAVVRAGLCDGQHWHHLQQEGQFFREWLWRQGKSALEGYRLAGDWNLWRGFSKHTEYYQLNKPLGAFRKREGQMSIVHLVDYNGEIDMTLPIMQRRAGFENLHDQRFFLWCHIFQDVEADSLKIKRVLQVVDPQFDYFKTLII